MATTEVEVWVLVDQDGDYEIAKDREELQPAHGLASRLIRLTVTVPTPVPVELAATVAALPSAGELTAA